MKLPMIGNGQEEIPGTTTVSVWNQVKTPAQTSPVGVCSQQGKRPYQEDEFAVSFELFLSECCSLTVVWNCRFDNF